jgi:hypothetical protein
VEYLFTNEMWKYFSNKNGEATRLRRPDIKMQPLHSVHNYCAVILKQAHYKIVPLLN